MQSFIFSCFSKLSWNCGIFAKEQLPSGNNCSAWTLLQVGGMVEISDFSCLVCLHFNTFKFKLNSNVLVLAMQWIMSNLVSLHNRPMSALNLPKLQAYCWNFLNSNRILAFKKFSNCSFIFKNAYHVECPRMHGRRIWRGTHHWNSKRDVGCWMWTPITLNLLYCYGLRSAVSTNLPSPHVLYLTCHTRTSTANIALYHLFVRGNILIFIIHTHRYTVLSRLIYVYSHISSYMYTCKYEHLYVHIITHGYIYKYTIHPCTNDHTHKNTRTHVCVYT